MNQYGDLVQEQIEFGSSEELKQAGIRLTKSDSKRLNCDVPKSLYKRLQIKAIQQNTSITAVVNRLVYEYVNHVEK